MKSKPKNTKYKEVSESNKSTFKYATPSVATSLIVFGLLINWGLPLTIGFILGLVWAFRYSKSSPKLRFIWWVIVALIINSWIYIIFVDIDRFFISI